EKHSELGQAFHFALMTFKELIFQTDVRRSVSTLDMARKGVINWMSGKALRDLNMLPGAERRNENSSKVNLTKPQSYTESTNENHDKSQKENPASLSPAPLKEAEGENTGSEVGAFEVEYIESEKLVNLDDVDGSITTLLTGLDSKDWVMVCGALNTVRRLSIFHKEAMLEILGNVISLIVKCLKNPRSAVCKTAAMTCKDIFEAYGDHVIDSMDPLLLQLLLKSSQDKRFVCEAAERALVAMTTSIPSTMLLAKVQPYLKHKNPRIRAKASMCFSRSVKQLGTEGIKTYGIDKLIQIGATQLSDQLPESREAARTLLLELQTVYEQFIVAEQTVESGPVETGAWELFCQSKLSPLSAQAVLRVTTKQGFLPVS
ncbi:hypothetical protein GIB67_004289, partial [Kingdonia uniflora]